MREFGITSRRHENVGAGWGERSGAGNSGQWDAKALLQTRHALCHCLIRHLRYSCAAQGLHPCTALQWMAGCDSRRMRAGATQEQQQKPGTQPPVLPTSHHKPTTTNHPPNQPKVNRPHLSTLPSGSHWNNPNFIVNPVAHSKLSTSVQ